MPEPGCSVDLVHSPVHHLFKFSQVECEQIVDVYACLMHPPNQSMLLRPRCALGASARVTLEMHVHMRNSRLGGKTRESLELRENHFCGFFVREFLNLWGTEGAKGPKSVSQGNSVPLRIAEFP